LLLALVSASLIGLVVAGVAAADADFVSSDPKDKATISAEPVKPIVLTFSEALGSGSRADIAGPGNAKVGTATVDSSSNKRLRFVPDAPLPAGGYTIAWTSIATDGHVLRGKLTFTVASAATPSPSALASASAAASPTVAPSAAPSPDDAAASDTSAILPVIAAIAIIATLGVVLLRNRRPAARP